MESKTGTRYVSWVRPGTRCATELSGNGTLPWHATKPEAKNHYRWIAEG
jgi:hypothetical protein